MDVTSPFTSVCKDGKKQMYLGRHVLAEFFECDSIILNDTKKIEKLMVEAALECGATVVQKCFHMFNPFGVSGVVIISESHLAIHTWPELGYAAVDLFTCGSRCNPIISYEYLKKKLKSQNTTFSELKRGILDNKTKKVKPKAFEITKRDC